MAPFGIRCSEPFRKNRIGNAPRSKASSPPSNANSPRAHRDAAWPPRSAKPYCSALPTTSTASGIGSLREDVNRAQVLILKGLMLHQNCGKCGLFRKGGPPRRAGKPRNLGRKSRLQKAKNASRDAGVPGFGRYI